MIKATFSSGSGWGALTVWSSPATALLGQVISSNLLCLFFPFHIPTLSCREASAHCLCSFPCSGPSERICPSLKSFLVFLLVWDSPWIRTDNWFPPTESFTFINPKSICLLALRKVRSSSGGSQQSHPWETCILFCHKEQRRFLLAVIAIRQMIHNTRHGSPSMCFSLQEGTRTWKLWGSRNS